MYKGEFWNQEKEILFEIDKTHRQNQWRNSNVRIAFLLQDE